MRINPGIEVFQKDFFSSSTNSLPMCLCSSTTSLKKACYLDLREHEGSSGYEKTLGRTSVQ